MRIFVSVQLNKYASCTIRAGFRTNIKNLSAFQACHDLTQLPSSATNRSRMAEQVCFHVVRRASGFGMIAANVKKERPLTAERCSVLSAAKHIDRRLQWDIS